MSYAPLTRIDDGKMPTPPREFAWHFARDVRFIALYLPCGCFNLLPVNLAPGFTTSWDWDRNVSEPTLSPSLRCTACCWHGYLRRGAFETITP